MYEFVGEKIKKMTVIICGIGIVLSIIAGVLMMFTGGFLTGIIIAVVGALGSWISGFMLYGYGEIVDNLMEINYRLQHMEANAPSRSTGDPAPVTNNNKPFYSGATPGAAPAQGWRCTCGREHSAYESSCVCGMSKRDVMTKQ